VHDGEADRRDDERDRASLDKPSTFKGVFTIPHFKTCGALTAVLNQLIPGPGNTFRATARP
jgi:hypothetical protein